MICSISLNQIDFIVLKSYVSMNSETPNIFHNSYKTDQNRAIYNEWYIL